MSEVHVYGIVPAGAKPDIAADGVRLVAHRDVAALVSDVDGDRVHAPRLLRTHWRVLERAAGSTTVLPVRFGTVMAGERAVVEELLAPSHDALAAALAELAGKVQLTVKGFYDEQALMASVVERSPAIARLREEIGRLPEAAAYYRRIELGRLVAAEVERARERDARAILERLEPHALAARLEPPSTADAAVNAAFLVDERRIEEFSDAVGALGRELAGRIRLRYVGPLPPYSFAGEESRAWA